MIDDPLEAFVQRLALHTALDDEDLAALRALPVTAKALAAHRDFIRLGDSSDHSYLVASGIVGRFSQMRSGARQIAALHIPGDMADLCSVVFPQSSWAFQALCRVEVLCIPHAALRDIARKRPRIAEAFWRDCVVDLSIMSEGMLTLGRRTAIARIAHLLCEMSCRHRQAGMVAEDHFAWRLRQAHVGDLLGLTPVHVNRMFRMLREQGLVTFSGEMVTIHDFAALARIGEFDPVYLRLSCERG
jgi:CRP-like cAMP-binding protein